MGIHSWARRRPPSRLAYLTDRLLIPLRPQGRGRHLSSVAVPAGTPVPNTPRSCARGNPGTTQPPSRARVRRDEYQVRVSTARIVDRVLARARPPLAVPGVSIYARVDGGGFSRQSVEFKITSSRRDAWTGTAQ
ncbi:hypothetical protein FKP32DRAFT_1679943 [Trametes sanguinea]|nr:hypothetical protein FKP32DRAFT_1679943 [Trametes sanguinea]